MRDTERRTAMDESGRDQRNREVSLRGRLLTNPVADFSPAIGAEVATADIRADDMTFHVSGTGDTALRMSESAIGAEVEISGQLTAHVWKTEDQREHERWVITVSTWLPA